MFLRGTSITILKPLPPKENELSASWFLYFLIGQKIPSNLNFWHNNKILFIFFDASLIGINGCIVKKPSLAKIN